VDGAALTRSAVFFIERQTGETWCEVCVPAAIAHATTEAMVRGDYPPQFLLVEPGELIYRSVAPRDRASRECVVRPACSQCGKIQSPGA